MTGLLLLGLTAGWLAACFDEAPPLDPNALAQFRITLLDTSALGEAPPYDFTNSLIPIRISVEALHSDGSLKEDYTGTLQARIVPGLVEPATSLLRLTNGVNPSHTLRIRYAFGHARIWLEEVGADQADECRNGYDDDGNGLIDYPGDPGCYGVEDPSEGGASYITGISDPLQFKPIGIREVQFNQDVATGGSPLEGEEVILEKGTLIVNNITADGFFLTDVDETRGYGSMFIYNYNYPEGLQLGDKLHWITGGVSEYMGGTQLTFPGWSIDESYPIGLEDRIQMSRCEPIDNPDVIDLVPTTVTPVQLNDYAYLESLEGGLVTVQNVEISTTFMDCDLNTNGAIEGMAEEICRDDCQRSNLCTELSAFQKYEQVSCNVSGSRVYLLNVGTVANLDVMEGCVETSSDPPTLTCPQRVLASATGSLKHVYLTRTIQLWEITPRFTCDLRLRCIGQEDCPEGQECVDQICNRASVQ